MSRRRLSCHIRVDSTREDLSTRLVVQILGTGGRDAFGGHLVSPARGRLHRWALHPGCRAEDPARLGLPRAHDRLPRMDPSADDLASFALDRAEITEGTEKTAKHREAEQRRHKRRRSNFFSVRLRCFVPPCTTDISVYNRYLRHLRVQPISPSPPLPRAPAWADVAPGTLRDRCLPPDAAARTLHRIPCV